MQHAKRMVVVPESLLSKVRHQQNVQGSPLTQKLSSLDSEMDQVLRRTDLEEDEKVQLYNQTLQRYLNFYEQRKDQPLKVKVESHPSVPIRTEVQNRSMMNNDGGETKPDEIENEVLQTVPKTLKAKASHIMNKIKKNKDVMHWNGKGELVYHGETIPGTHVVDLIRDVVKERKSFDPNGWQFFARGLAKLNLPFDWFSNDRRKEVMRQFKTRIDEGIPEGDEATIGEQIWF